MQTIHELRKAGNKVRVTHYRYLHEDIKHWEETNRFEPPAMFQDRLKPAKHLKEFNEPIGAKGGKTTIEITTPKGENFAAEVFCHPKDAFNRKLGIIKCLGRLQKYLTNA